MAIRSQAGKSDLQTAHPVGRTEDLPQWGSIVIVPLPFIVQLSVWLLDQDLALYKRLFHGEDGLIELATAGILVPALVVAAIAARLLSKRKLRLAAAILVVYAFGCFWLLGEELSWGQQIFGWQSPAYFEAQNLQGETNLHNMKFFDKKLLKWSFVIAIGIGGGLIPLGALVSGVSYRPRFHWIVWLIPTRAGFTAASVAFLVHMFVKNPAWFGLTRNKELHDIRLAETTELYVAIFLAVYALSLYRRLRSVAGLPDDRLIVGP
jgi:hypothetical protein